MLSQINSFLRVEGENGNKLTPVIFFSSMEMGVPLVDYHEAIAISYSAFALSEKLISRAFIT